MAQYTKLKKLNSVVTITQIQIRISIPLFHKQGNVCATAAK